MLDDDISKKKKKKAVWKAFKELSPASVDQSTDGKVKYVNKKTLKIDGSEGTLYLLGSFSIKNGKIGGEIKGLRFVENNTVSSVDKVPAGTVFDAKGYKIKVTDFLKAISDLQGGDAALMSKLLFGIPLVFKGSSGNDTFPGGPKADKLDGKGGNDNLFGNSGNDVLIGGPGNDGLYGGPGKDKLDGGPGTNTLHGDLGNDWFILSSLSGYSFIQDFGPGDKVGLKQKAFSDLGPKGALNPNKVEFSVNDATKAGTRLFTTPTGEMIYDTNGSAPGGETAIAQFQSGVPTDAGQLFVV